MNIAGITETFKTKFYGNWLRSFLLMAFTLSLTGCSTLASKADTGVVIARRAQVRSSFAVVAADLSEVVRGDVVDILDSTIAENGERWLRVRG